MWILDHSFLSRTPDRHFRCCYPCEIVLSHTPIPALGKIKKNSSTLAARRFVMSLLCYRDVTLSHLSIFRIFWKSFSYFFQYKMRYKVVSKKKNPSLVNTVCHHSASLVMPIGDPRDGFFYPTLTLIMDTYSLAR